LHEQHVHGRRLLHPRQHVDLHLRRIRRSVHDAARQRGHLQRDRLLLHVGDERLLRRVGPAVLPDLDVLAVLPVLLGAERDLYVRRRRLHVSLVRRPRTTLLRDHELQPGHEQHRGNVQHGLPLRGLVLPGELAPSRTPYGAMSSTVGK
jgi:hypothetical protein